MDIQSSTQNGVALPGEAAYLQTICEKRIGMMLFEDLMLPQVVIVPICFICFWKLIGFGIILSLGISIPLGLLIAIGIWFTAK